MLTIRFQRKGRANQVFFKIVVTEKTKSSTRGRFAEELGFYNPVTKEKKINGERAKYWISKGAQPSVTVHNLLISSKIIEGTKIANHKLPKGRPADEAGQPASTPTISVAPVAPLIPKPEPTPPPEPQITAQPSPDAIVDTAKPAAS